MLVDRVNTTATVWLGTTLGCAQCHNHKYDPFTQKDYYRMLAFFANTDYDVRTFGDGTRFFEATLDLATPEQEEQRKTIQADIDRLDAADDGAHARHRDARRRVGTVRCVSAVSRRGSALTPRRSTRTQAVSR